MEIQKFSHRPLRSVDKPEFGYFMLLFAEDDKERYKNL